MQRKEKILSLQALRAIAFIAIFASHTYGDLIDCGAWGVSIFVVLSGFCMMLAYKNRKMPTKLNEMAMFSIRKMKKLYPLHIITLFVALIFIGLNRTLLRDLFLDILLVQAWVPSAAFSINGVAWYLSLSIFLYFMFPIIRKKVIAEKSKKNLMFIAGLIFVVQIWVGYAANLLASGGVDAKWVTYIWPLYRLGDFAIGCILGYLYSERTQKQPNFKLSTLSEGLILTLLIALEAFLFFTPILPDNTWFRFNIIYTPLSVLFVYLFAMKGGLFVKILTNKLTIFIGNISGYAFLIHTIVLYYLAPLILQDVWLKMPRWGQAIAAFAFTVAISYLYIKIDTLVNQHLAARHPRRRIKQ